MQQLCKMLTEKPRDIDTATDPPVEQLEVIQVNILRLEFEKTSRLALCEKTKQTDELEMGPRSLFEAGVISASVSTIAKII